MDTFPDKADEPNGSNSGSFDKAVRSQVKTNEITNTSSLTPSTEEAQIKEKIVGIIGGMGPEATVDLMQRIIQLTPALDDADHIRCIVDNNPKIPSRIKAIIEGNGEDPAPCMADMARRLESWGADFLAIPCNTAHYYYEGIQEAVTIPVVHLIDLVCDHVRLTFPDHRKVGILASPAVAMTGLYTQRLQKMGIQDLWPDSDFQEKLLQVIKTVKKGDRGPEMRNEYERVCENLIQKGAKIVIVACTELSALGLGDKLPLLAVDAAHLLALEIIKRAKPFPG